MFFISFVSVCLRLFPLPVNIVKSSTNILPGRLIYCDYQTRFKFDILELLDESSVLVVQDWAMKYLPRKHRESQTDWFGKRGIPWNISVAFRKISDQFQMLTFAHIFQTCTQDSCAVLAVMVDVIKQLNNIIPGLKKVSFRKTMLVAITAGPPLFVQVRYKQS